MSNRRKPTAANRANQQLPTNFCSLKKILIETTSSHVKVLAINIFLSEQKSDQLQQAANSLLLACEHLPGVNNKPNESAFLIWNKATVGYNIQFQSEI